MLFDTTNTLLRHNTMAPNPPSQEGEAISNVNGDDVIVLEDEQDEQQHEKSAVKAVLDSKKLNTDCGNLSVRRALLKDIHRERGSGLNPNFLRSNEAKVKDFFQGLDSAFSANKTFSQTLVAKFLADFFFDFVVASDDHAEQTKRAATESSAMTRLRELIQKAKARSLLDASAQETQGKSTTKQLGKSWKTCLSRFGLFVQLTNPFYLLKKNGRKVHC
jgi:hypothetical protein